MGIVLCPRYLGQLGVNISFAAFFLHTAKGSATYSSPWAIPVMGIEKSDLYRFGQKPTRCADSGRSVCLGYES